jgi:hypothetical protein
MAIKTTNEIHMKFLGGKFISPEFTTSFLLFCTVCTIAQLSGCSTPKQPKVGGGIIHVPKEYEPNLGWIGVATTDYEFYLESYREGYWDCIQNYIGNIEYVSTASDYDKQVGWMSQITGWQNGYSAAERDMHSNIERFGKKRTAEYLKEIADGGGF